MSNGGLFGRKTNKDPMRQSSALTTVFLLQQNQKFEQFMKVKVEDLETRVAAQQARISAKDEQAEQEVFADLEGLDDLFSDMSDRLDSPAALPSSKQAAPAAASAAPQHPGASLGLKDSEARQPGSSKTAPPPPEEPELPGGGEEDTPVDMLELMMGGDEEDNGEPEPDEVETDLSPTVATPPISSPMVSQPVVPAPAPTIPTLPTPLPPPPSSAVVAPARTFDVASEYEPLFANRFSTAAQAQPVQASPESVEPTRPVPVQPIQPSPALVEPTRPVQLPAAADKAGPGTPVDEQAEQQPPDEEALEGWETDLDGEAEPAQGEEAFEGWETDLDGEAGQTSAEEGVEERHTNLDGGEAGQTLDEEALEGWETDLDGDTEQPPSDPSEWEISLADETEGDES